MPKRSGGALTALQTNALGPGLHSDGNNLYLRVKETLKSRLLRTWSFIFRSPITGKQREAGLGPVADKNGKNGVTLAEARKRAAEGRAMLNEKPPRDPLDVWRAPPPSNIPTFKQALDDYLELNAPAWRSSKHLKQWRSTVEDHAGSLFKMKVDQIGVAEVLAVLTPLWSATPESAGRLRQRIEAVINSSMPADTTKPNPARWKGCLDKKLPRLSSLGKIDRQTGARIERDHHAALPYADAPAFVVQLRAEGSKDEASKDDASKDETSPFEISGGSICTPALALEFLILTVARTHEVIGAKWSEIDVSARTWTIPVERLKTGKKRKGMPHTVPLSSRALAIIEAMDRVRTGPYLFAGRRDGRPLGASAFLQLLHRMGVTGVTIHGFRSTFRDWAGDETHFAREVCEHAVGHVVQGAEGAYRRGNAFSKRRELMLAWDAYLASTPADGAALRQAQDAAGAALRQAQEAADATGGGVGAVGKSIGVANEADKVEVVSTAADTPSNVLTFPTARSTARAARRQTTRS